MKEKLKIVFFNESLRHWHFEVLKKSTNMSRERLHHYLKELQKENFIQKIKPKGKMPYYITNRNSSKFRKEKCIYGLKMLQELFEHLTNCEGIKTAILFGSFARGDWSKSSDIDLFIYGVDKEFEKGMFEKKLKREIQVFIYNNPTTMKKELDQNLIPNIVKGFHITESIEPFEVSIHV